MKAQSCCCGAPVKQPVPIGGPDPTQPPPPVEPDVPAGSADPAQVAQQLAAPGTGINDLQTLTAVVAEMQKSATSSQKLNELLSMGVPVRIVDDATFDTMDSTALAVYNNDSNDIVMPASFAASNARSVAVMLTHEAAHAVADQSGIRDQAMNAFLSQFPDGQIPDETSNQAVWEINFANEVAAHRIEAQAALELGMTPPSGHPAVDATTGGVRDYATTWRAFEASAEYGDYNTERRSASDAAIAYYAQLFGGIG